MSDNCGKCNVLFVKSDAVAKCEDCKVAFHSACTRDGSNRNFTKGRNKAWKCDSCKDDASSVRSGDDQEDKKSILQALAEMEVRINKNTDSKFSAVQGSIDSLKDDFRKLDRRILDIEAGQSNLETRVAELERSNAVLSGEVCELRGRQQDADQHSRCANIEIVGVPLTQGEDIYLMLSKLAEVIGVVDHRKEDISMAHRLRVYSQKLSCPPVVVQFVSRWKKEEWLAAARRKRNIDSRELSADMQASRVYVNNHLTGHNKALLGRARQLLRERKLIFAGYTNGKVLVKASDRDVATRVVEMTDLDKYV